MIISVISTDSRKNKKPKKYKTLSSFFTTALSKKNTFAMMTIGGELYEIHIKHVSMPTTNITLED